MNQEVGNQNQNQPAIDSSLCGLSEAMKSKAMLDGFEERFDCPPSATQSHEVDSRVRISGDNKAEFSFAVCLFEPEPGDGEWDINSLQLDLLTSPAVAGQGCFIVVGEKPCPTD
jgi:hypothetical protein